MALRAGDHLVVKRDGRILSPASGEACHEFEIIDPPAYVVDRPTEGLPQDAFEALDMAREKVGYLVKLRVVR